jgi:plasmid maintenance system antidote protein VapI
MAAMSRGSKISERLRAAIRGADTSLNRMAQETGVAVSVLSRFVRGEQGITLDTADVLASYLGLDLLPAKRQSKGR